MDEHTGAQILDALENIEALLREIRDQSKRQHTEVVETMAGLEAYLSDIAPKPGKPGRVW